MQVACPRPLRGGAQSGLEPATCESQVRSQRNRVKHCDTELGSRLVYYKLGKSLAVLSMHVFNLSFTLFVPYVFVRQMTVIDGFSHHFVRNLTK